MANFEFLKSSLFLSPSSQNHFFLTSAINWELASTKEISTKVKEVKSVCFVMNTHFKYKTKPWQVDFIMDIIKCKRNICAIAGTSNSKNLVYLSILFVIKGSLFVILPIITLIKNQVFFALKMLYNHYLYWTIWFFTPNRSSYYCTHFKCLG